MRDSAESLAELRREVHRCRRYRRSLALLGIPLTAADGHRALRSSVRVLDTIWQDGSQFFVLLPETGREAAREMVARLARSEPSVLDVAMVRIAVFPDDAMTLGSLLAAASVSSENTRPFPDAETHGQRSSLRRLPPRRKLAAIFRGGSSYEVPAGLTRPRPTDG